MAHCRSQLPNEACGLLGGRGSDVLQVVPARNIQAGPVSYEVDPADTIRALREFRAAGLDLIAIYHSHPRHPAAPSRTDLQFAAPWRQCWFVIVSFTRKPPDVRAFRLDGHSFAEAVIECQDDEPRDPVSPGVL